MRRIRWRTLAATTAGLVCVSAAAGGAALASSAQPGVGSRAAAGVRGNPQPELRPFKIGAASGAGGAVAIEPNGALVVAYGVTSGNGKVVVCVLDRGGSKCAHRVTLSPLSGDDLFGTPQVIAASANHIVVVMDTCCDANTNGDTLVYSSANGGTSFGTPVRVGSTVGVSTAALVGGQIIFTSGDDTNGLQVEAIPVSPAGPPAQTAVANATEAFDVGVGSYKGGALAASDYAGTPHYTTYVEYAAAGKNFDVSASYRRVGTFSDESLIGVSGDALLTELNSGNQELKLRLFNGTSFGPAHVVPGTSGGGPEWFAVDQDPRGKTYVFSVRAFSSDIYHLFDVSTWTGAAWSAPVNLGDAIQDNAFAAGLDANGSGLVLGTSPAWGYPVLAPQGVSLSLKAAAIAKGHTTEASGTGSPVAKGRLISLQAERSGLWYTVATAHENGSGAFSFTIKGSAAGTYHYRAVVADFAGYLEYGYSAVRTLTVS